jgi:hypothetical protein
LGTVVLGIVVPILLWLVAYSMIGLIFKKYAVFKKKITDTIFWDKTFLFISETYILLAMCAALNFQYLMWDTAGNVVNVLLACVIMVIVVAFPIFTGIFYSNP